MELGCDSSGEEWYIMAQGRAPLIHLPHEMRLGYRG